ncbi:MAG: PAS domain-containing sensor histidine kinase, partial [Anaerolineales bacterium]|nr:PAS domain-containing sensor histidine kinase [Anaerolineales bacterium]
DTGIGIPAEKLPTLWDGFAQMADPVKRSAEGVGLGLTLVKYIVSAHNGDVYANSEEKVGSVFGFAIPLKQ